MTSIININNNNAPSLSEDIIKPEAVYIKSEPPDWDRTPETDEGIPDYTSVTVKEELMYIKVEPGLEAEHVSVEMLEEDNDTDRLSPWLTKSSGSITPRQDPDWASLNIVGRQEESSGVPESACNISSLGHWMGDVSEQLGPDTIESHAENEELEPRVALQHAVAKDNESDDKKAYHCSLCKRGYSSRRCLTRHIKVHDVQRPILQCTECDATYLVKSSYIKHLRLYHTRQKNKMCSNCKEVFPDSDSLSKHLTLNEGEAPVICHICESYFSHCNPHVKQYMSQLGRKMYRCEMCCALHDS